MDFAENYLCVAVQKKVSMPDIVDMEHITKCSTIILLNPVLKNGILGAVGR